jgi:hypothetical protein
VTDFLPLGSGRESMVIPGFLPGTEGMGWPHVADVVHPSELQSAYVFGNPPLTDSVNLAPAKHAHPAC